MLTSHFPISAGDEKFQKFVVKIFANNTVIDTKRYLIYTKNMTREETMKCLLVNFPIERLNNVIKNAKNMLSDHVDVTFSHLSR